MKKISRLIQLLPFARLEDFPTHLKGDLAAGILSNWTAAWHPLLISAAQSAPVVFGADQTFIDNTAEQTDVHNSSFEDEPASSPSGFDADFWKDSVVFVPEISLESIANGFAAKAVGENAKLITGLVDRQEIIQRCFQLTGLQASPPIAFSQFAPHSPNVQAFYALAYAYLQIQLLTRKIRYSSNLDQATFDQKLVQAAHAFTNNDASACNAAISSCYDLLLQEKNNYYPVQPTLIDLVLTTAKTVGPRLEKELDSKQKNNFLITGETLSAVQTPAVGKLKSKLATGQASVIGGNETELPDALLSPETTLRKLKRGLALIHRTLDYDVNIFMRRRFGLMPSLPNILDQLNFTGAMHTALDGGKFPAGSFGTIRWAGDAEASIISKAEPLLDASDPATMLDLGVKIGRQIDSSHDATCTFAHWPGRTHQAYADLQNVAARSTLLGEFSTLDDHFETLYDPGYADNFSSAEYASPFLAEAIRASSEVTLSRFVDYWRQYFLLHQLECLVTLWFLVLVAADSENIRQKIQPWTQRCDRLFEQAETLAADWSHDAETIARIDTEIADATEELLAEFSPQSPSETSNEPSRNSVIPNSVINPLFFTRRTFVAIRCVDKRGGIIKTKKPYALQQITARHLYSMNECAGSSISAILASDGKTAPKQQPAVLEGTKLQNEFFVATIDEKTGGLTSILFHGKRGNRASQRLVYQNSRSKVASEMICEKFESNAASVLCGEIKTSGRIVVGKDTVARFTQVFKLTRGQRVLDLEIDIRPTIVCGRSANKYFGHRLAWRDEACKIFGSDQFVRGEIYEPKIQSPNFVEIENLDYALTLLPGGLPYHNRINRRQLDTLLVVGDEKTRRFKIGIGVDLKYPLKSAIARACPALVTQAKYDQMHQLFHLDSKNILVTAARPVFSDDNITTAIDMRFQETERRGGQVSLFTPFKMSEIHRTNFNGDIIQTLHDTGAAPVSQFKFPYAAADYFQIRIVPASN